MEPPPDGVDGAREAVGGVSNFVETLLASGAFCAEAA